MRLLKAGDAVFEGETVVTQAGGKVELAFADGHMMAVLPNETFLLTPEVAEATRPAPEEAAVSTADIQKVIQAIEQGLPIDEQLAAAAAGVSGAGENAGHSFVRLLRIAEGVEPLAYQFPYPQEVVIREPEGVVTEEIIPPPVPTVTLTGVEGEPIWIKEDADESEWGGEMVLISASTNAGSHLTQIVITGFNAGWGYDFSSLGTEGIDWTFSAGTLTILNLSGTSYAGTFKITSLPDDSDVDMGTLTAVATAVNDTDPTISATATDTLVVNVDAVLDRAVDFEAESYSNSGTESGTPLTLSLGMDGASVIQPFSASGWGGADQDGSESGTVTITLAEVLPEGAYLWSTAGTVTGSGTTYTLIGWTTPADLADAINGLQVTVPAGYFGTISGTIGVTFTDAVSDASNDPTDNTYSDSATFTVTVNALPPGEPRPENILVEEESIPTVPGPGVIGNDESDGLSYSVSGTIFDNVDWGAGGFDGVTKVTYDGTDYTTVVDGKITVQTAAWKLEVTVATGDYTFTMLDNLLVSGAGENLVPLLPFIITAASNGHSVDIPLAVQVQDDVPVIGTPTPAFLANEIGSVLVGDLGLSIGADKEGASVLLSGQVNGDGYVVGTYKDNGTTHSLVLTSNGQPLHYTTVGGMLVAEDPAGNDVFTVTADPLTGLYTLNIVGTLDAATRQFDANLPSHGGGGNKEIVPVQDGIWLVFTAKNFDGSTSTVNYSNQGMGVNGGDSVDNSAKDALGSEQLIVHFTKPVVAAPVYLSQLTFITDSLDGAKPNEPAEIGYWTAYKDGGVVGTGSFEGTGSGASTDETWTISLYGGDVSDVFDQIVFTAEDGTGYRIADLKGAFLIGDVDVSINLTAQGIDGDGDMTSAVTFPVTFENDTALIGTLGDDVLAGGSGSETLTGGGGADVFAWQLADSNAVSPPTDVVKDFNAGDILNLSDLLSTGYNVASVIQDSAGTMIEVHNTSSQLVQTIYLEGYTGGDATSILSELNANKTYTGEV